MNAGGDSSNLVKLFGKRIKYLRRLNSMTQAELAERVGLSRRQISRIELGRSSPHFSTLEKFCPALKTNIFQLFLFPEDIIPDQKTGAPSGSPEDDRNGQLLVSPSLAGLWTICNSSGRMEMEWSASLFRYLGYSRSSVKPSLKRFLHRVDPECRTELSQFIASSLHERSPARLIIRMKSPKGDRRRILILKEPQGDDCANPGLITLAILDVTEILELQDRLTLNKDQLENDLKEKNRHLVRIYEQARQELSIRRKIQEELKHQARLLQNISDNVFDLVSLTDMEGNFKFVGASHKILGYDLDSLIGRNVMDFIHPEDYPGVLEVFENFLLHKINNQKVEYRYRRADGSYLHLETIGSFILDDHGNPREIIFSTRDITERRQKEKQIRKSEKRFREILDSIEDGYYETNLNGTITFANRAGARIHGYSDLDEYIGLNFRQFCRDPEKVVETFMRVLESGKPDAAVPIEMTRKDGSVGYAELSVTPLTNRKGRIKGFRGIGRDITERKKAQDDLQVERLRLQNVIKATGVAAWEWNVQSGDHVIDERWAEIIGFTLQELTPVSISTWQNAVHPDDLKMVNTLLDKHFTGKLSHLDCEYRMRHRQGHWVWVQDLGQVATYTSEGKPLLMYGTLSDITQKKNDSEKLKKTNQELKKAIAEKNMFLSIISHDLKSPLAGLLSLSSFLNHELETLSEPELRRITEAVHKSAQGVFELLNDLLEWSVICRKTMECKTEICNLYHLIQEAINSVRTACQQKDINLVCSVPMDMTVNADMPMILTVLRNLLFNAVKFSSRGGKISVTATKKDSRTQICILDNGVGMDQTQLSRLFTMDRRGRHPGTQGERGTGLGLIICRELIAMHGGEIWLKSRPGQGTGVFFTLPGHSSGFGNELDTAQS